MIRSITLFAVRHRMPLRWAGFFSPIVPLTSDLSDILDVFATSSSSIDPLRALHDLSREAQESPVLANMASNHVVNRTVQRFYLLVHDVAREGPDLIRRVIQRTITLRS